ncbi:MAG: hypothetical protein ACRC06_11170 [Waterburya sp.]
MPQIAPSNQIPKLNQQINIENVQKAVFTHNGRIYVCSKSCQELRIRNDRGDVLAIHQGDRQGLIGKTRNEAKSVNVTQPPYFELIKAALQAIAQDNT